MPKIRVRRPLWQIVLRSLFYASVFALLAVNAADRFAPAYFRLASVEAAPPVTPRPKSLPAPKQWASASRPAAKSDSTRLVPKEPRGAASRPASKTPQRKRAVKRRESLRTASGFGRSFGGVSFQRRVPTAPAPERRTLWNSPEGPDPESEGAVRLDPSRPVLLSKGAEDMVARPRRMGEASPEDIREQLRREREALRAAARRGLRRRVTLGGGVGLAIFLLSMALSGVPLGIYRISNPLPEQDREG